LLWEERFARDGWMVTSGQYQRSTRGRIPAWFSKQPPWSRGQQNLIRAFRRLETHRQHTSNGGFGPIPYNAIREFAAPRLRSPWVVDYFCDAIYFLDMRYRQSVAKERDAEAQREARAARRNAASAGAKGRR